VRIETQTYVERAARGDERAVEALLMRYMPDLDRYVRRRAGAIVEAKESASDLVQSTCREILQNLDRFRYDGEEGFRRWLFATALRKIRDRHRYYRAERRDAKREAAPAPEASDEKTRAFFVTLCTPSRDAAVREELQRSAPSLRFPSITNR
jgi:RNA polymerase sigma factor (sigma-70 family)